MFQAELSLTGVTRTVEGSPTYELTGIIARIELLSYRHSSTFLSDEMQIVDVS
jgi:hypothetical protein